jgi:flagellar basal-body rod protein FlgG
MYHTSKEPGAQSGENAMSPTGVQTGLGVRTAATQKNFDIGSTLVTKGALDMQIEGSGFFQVMTPDGQIGYTRDGAFRKDATGRLVDKNGFALQPEIVIPPDSKGVEISAAGVVSITQGNSDIPVQLGQIDLATFVNPAGLKAAGKNIFYSTGSSGAPQVQQPGVNGSGFISQGQLEGSNVNIVDEMVNMITAQRAYETNSKVIQAADQMLQSVNALR